MDFIKRNKILGVAVIGLVIINVLLLTFVWLGKDGRGQRGYASGGGKFLEEQLGLTADQKQKVKSFRDAHFKLVESLREKSKENRDELHDLLKSPNSELTAQELASRLGQIQSQIEFSTFKHFSDIRSICNEQQKKIFDETILSILRGQGVPEGPKGDRPPPREGPEGRRPPPQRGG
ncbi:MAG: protein CpxP [Roseivirga sp.]|jgi:protein CpxP